MQFALPTLPFPQPIDIPPPIETQVDAQREAAEVVFDLLVEIKGSLIDSMQSNVDREKIQADIEAWVVQIEVLAPIAGFEGAEVLGEINVRDTEATEAMLDTIDAVLASLIDFIEDLTQAEEDQYIVGSRRSEDIVTGNGDDIIEARGGNDVVDAGGGDDVVLGGHGRDRHPVRRRW